MNGQTIALIGEVGYFGERKEQLLQNLDDKFGVGQWQLRWYVDGKVESHEKALELYEEGYFEFLRSKEEVLDWLVKTASDVYDLQPSNVASGLDYSIQECRATHLQDIAVRRVLKRLDRKFQGSHLMQIRGHESEGYLLNPGKVPFHRPELILPSNERGWWGLDSVEAFYQQNKLIVVNPGSLALSPEIETPNGEIIFCYDRATYYQAFQGSRQFFQRLPGRAVRRQAHLVKGHRFLRNQKKEPLSNWL